MIKHIIKSQALIILLIVAAALKMGAQDFRGSISNYLSEQISVHGIPGLAVAVVRDGEVLYVDAFGVRQIGEAESLTPEHVFHFASVSKPFVATAIMQLVEKGLMDLDEPLITYLPYFSLADDRYKNITIRQMLNHTSGMPDVKDYEWDKPQSDEGSAERYVRQIAKEKLLWEPGESWRYSNMAYDVLGDVIAKVSGMSFEAYIRKNIFQPVGMDGSSFIYYDIQEALRTTGHVRDPAKVSKVYPYNRKHAPSSTLNSSVSQMINWMQVNLNEGELNGQHILKADSYDLLYTNTIESVTMQAQVGLSWFLGEHSGHKTVSHGGGDTGFRSYILLLPDDHIGIVIASNWDGTNTQEITYGILDIILDSGD